jgi:hypothetical protein
MAEAPEKNQAQSPQSKRSRVSPDFAGHRNSQEVHEELDDSIEFDSEDFDWLLATSMGAVLPSSKDL